jgi:hypothetical protein
MPSPAKTSEASLVVRGLIDRLVDLLASFFGGSLGIEFILRRLDGLVDLLTSLLDRSFALTPNAYQRAAQHQKHATKTSDHSLLESTV